MQIHLPWLEASPESPFPAIERALRSPNGLLAAGGDLASARLLNAYAHGIFPWYSPGEPILWWSPDPRCVFFTDRMHLPRRLARSFSASRWTVLADTRFDAVIDACSETRDAGAGTWITAEMREAYRSLHRAGHAHSIEVLDGDELVGGLYGVSIGQMFFAESMFSARSNGSKAALLALAQWMRSRGWPLIDAQVPSPHLFTLGAHSIKRRVFLPEVARLVALAGPQLPWRQAFLPLPVAQLI